MNRHLRRGTMALVVVLAGLVVSSCGFDYQTEQPYAPGVGADDRSGQVDVLNAVVVSGEDGSGTFVAGLVNTSTDTDAALESVGGAGADTKLDVTGPKRIAVPAGQLVQLAKTGNISLEGSQIKAGGVVELTLTFAGSSSVTLSCPVVSHKDEYAEVPVPSGS